MIIKIALGLGKKNNSEILTAAALFTNSMTNDPLFAAADIVAQVTATVTATSNLAAAMNLPLSETKADQVRVCRDVLNRALNVLAAKVEAVANNPAVPDEHRIGIVHAAGMDVKGSASRAKQIFGVVRGEAAGSVYLTAASGPAAHEWQYTKDTTTFENRISTRITPNANITITGLESYVKYAFYHRAVVAENETSEWEGPLMIVVH